MLPRPDFWPRTCMSLCITGQGSWNEPSARCWDSSHVAVSCNFSGEPSSCSSAKLSTFSTKAVSLGWGEVTRDRGWSLQAQPTPSGTWLCPQEAWHLSETQNHSPNLTRCCCPDVTMPRKSHLFSETAGFACSLEKKGGS